MLPSKHSSWWRRLEEVFKMSFVFVFRRRLQDVLIKTNMFALDLHLQKTSSRRLGQDQYIRFGYTSSRRLQYVFKTNSTRLQDVLPRRLQDVFQTFLRRLAKTSSRYLQDILKTFSRRLQNVFKTSWKTSSRRPQGVFKMYHQVNLFLLTRLWEAFNTFLRRFFPKTIIYRGICPDNTTSDKFMVSVQNLQVR